MTTVYIQPGEVLSLTVPADVKSNDVVTIGAFTGVCTHDAKSGEVCEIGLVGVWELPKGSGALTQGQLVYWDSSAKKVAASAGSNGAPLLGAVTEAAGADAKVARVRLNGITT